ncbi:hypothetical protein ElyMa_006331500 [Elysia marginata]|uniref:Uncharacterized protein n=1 Tax=Elysia marginata TaxID=1093978 RepID=A0AAV4HKR0_9GAST|nr:hypothetical protein ElyMa_006331500 [Elysia marginata]
MQGPSVSRGRLAASLCGQLQPHSDHDPAGRTRRHGDDGRPWTHRRRADFLSLGNNKKGLEIATNQAKQISFHWAYPVFPVNNRKELETTATNHAEQLLFFSFVLVREDFNPTVLKPRAVTLTEK